MAFCPLDYRYGCQEFKEIWSELGRHQRQLEVERALIYAHNQLGRVSDEDYAKIVEISDPSVVTKERVSEIEAETRHDIMALTKAMAEKAGEAAWWRLRGILQRERSCTHLILSQFLRILRSVFPSQR